MTIPSSRTTPHRPPRRHVRIATPVALGLGAALLASAALAQVYRSVGPDGRVTYSDAPPAAAPQAASPEAAAQAPTAAAGAAALPYALRQSAQRYPVTLYAGSACEPCASGRQMLLARGIPFSEKTVESDADVAALQRLSGAGHLPLLTIGTQQLKGFSEAEWNQYLDAAGYPKASQLPRSWQRPAPSPLAPAAAAAPAPAAGTAPSDGPPATTAPPVSPTPTATNPAGIRF